MMNRPGTVHQTMRGIPGAFGGQQQQQQPPGRPGTNRMNGKLGNVNPPSWAFAGGMPLGGNVPQGSARQLGGSGNLSFAQSLSGTSQPVTPLDPSEFPSLSGTSQLNTSNQNSMWSGQTSRNLGQGVVHRGPGTPSSLQQQQEDPFASRLGAGPSFRFGNQGSAAQSSQGQPDEFPPLNRPTNGEIGGHDRGSNLMASLAFGSVATTSGSAMHPRAGNGLLNAISANLRTTDGVSPTAIQRPQDPRSPVGDDESRQKPSGYREDSLTSHMSGNDGVVGRNPLGAIGNDPPLGKAKEDEKGSSDAVQDPLERMAPIDKWGLKGLHYLMNNYQDYNALTCGIDPASLGVDLRSPDLISTQIYSLFNSDPPRPAIPKFKLPDCYEVKNVQPIENKITGFNEETLFWIFYSCPRDMKQQLAAMELVNRNWRWHKKLRLWLTKDDQLIPQALSHNHERGYYIVWDKDNWRKERRELTLFYADLDSSTPVQLVNGVSA